MRRRSKGRLPDRSDVAANQRLFSKKDLTAEFRSPPDQSQPLDPVRYISNVPPENGLCVAKACADAAHKWRW